MCQLTCNLVLNENETQCKRVVVRYSNSHCMRARGCVRTTNSFVFLRTAETRQMRMNTKRDSIKSLRTPRSARGTVCSLGHRPIRSSVILLTTVTSNQLILVVGISAAIFFFIPDNNTGLLISFTNLCHVSRTFRRRQRISNVTGSCRCRAIIVETDRMVRLFQ